MFRTIPNWEIDHYIESNSNLLIIDLRNRASYRTAHIKGAVNLPYEEMDVWINSFPIDKLLLFYCSRGGKSMIICRQLDQLGYNTLNVANGIGYYRGKYMVH